MPKFLLESTKSQIIPLYQKEGTFKKVASILNISASYVQKYITKNKVDKNPYAKRLYHFDDNYFSSINDENKAYWLGWIAADGCLYENKSDNSFITRISIISSDIEILNNLKFDINYQGKISILKSRFNLKHKRNNNSLCTISLCSHKLFSDLVKLGCTPKKSLTLKFPTTEQVPDHLLRHFIRGYFDGDGCVTQCNGYKNKKGIINLRPIISFCGTKEFLTSLREWLDKNGIKVQSALTKRRQNDTNSYSLIFKGYNRCNIFYNLIYSNSKRSLKRKQEKLEKLLNKNADVFI